MASIKEKDINSGYVIIKVKEGEGHDIAFGAKPVSDTSGARFVVWNTCEDAGLKRFWSGEYFNDIGSALACFQKRPTSFNS